MFTIDNSKQRKLGALLSYTNILFATVVGLIYTPFLIKMLGQNEYGLYSLMLALINFLAILDLGFGNAIVRFNSKLRAQRDENGIARLNGLFVIMYSVMAVIALLIGYIIVTNFEKFMGDSLSVDEISRAKIMFIILNINLAFTLFMSIYNSLLVTYERFVLVQVLNMFKTITGPIIMTPILLLGYTSIALVIVNVSLNVIVLSVAAIYCFRKIKVKIVFNNLQFGLFKEISTYSFFILLNILVDKLYAPTSQYILGVSAGTAAVAIYAIGVQFSGYFMMLSTSINGVYLPKITQLVIDGQKKIISDIFIKVGRIQFIILLFVLSGFLLFGKEFIILWAGPEYINSYYIALILMVPAIIPLSQNMGIVILQARNQLKFRVLIYLLLAILNVGGSYYLSKSFSEIGPAISMFIATLIGQIVIMNFYYYKKIEIDIPSYWKNVFGIFMKLLVVIVLSEIVKHIINMNYTWGSLFSIIAIYSVVMILVIYKFVFNEYEKSILKTFLIVVCKKMKLMGD